MKSLKRPREIIGVMIPKLLANDIYFVARIFEHLSCLLHSEFHHPVREVAPRLLFKIAADVGNAHKHMGCGILQGGRAQVLFDIGFYRSDGCIVLRVFNAVIPSFPPTAALITILT